MKKKLAFLMSAVMMISSFTGCGDNKTSSSAPNNTPIFTGGIEDMNEPPETKTETATEHISPVETFTSHDSVKVPVEKVIEYTKGKNEISIPLSSLIEDGDKIESFSFVIYSNDGNNIGTFKGGCGISVKNGCSAATDDGWFQSDEFTSPTEGTYGEITWKVPDNIKDYTDTDGELHFGYWWGGASTIKVESVSCSFTRTRDIPVDGTTSDNIGESVSLDSDSSIIYIPAFYPAGVTPQAAEFRVSSGGKLKQLVYSLGYSSSLGSYMSVQKAVFTGDSSAEFSWIIPDDIKEIIADDGMFTLGYWWSEQPEITLDSVTIKYSEGSGGMKTEGTPVKNDAEIKEETPDTGFRTSAEIVNDIKVGWNLGNSLESYDTGKKGLYTEIGWGNVKTTPEIMQSVKDAGFNAVRIPVTWCEHMDGDTIQKEWMDRVQEVVDYAYDIGMYVIINVHHDDYVWLSPIPSKAEANTKKLCSIWKQIAENFSDYDDRLIFEGINETRNIGSELEWMGGTHEEREVVNGYIQAFVDTVRETGGNNADRTLVVSTYGACAEEAALNDVVVPRGKNIILNVHYYAPWKFSDGQTTVFDDAGKSEIEAKFAYLKRNFIDNGIPVIIDEFGCQAAASDDVRAEYYSHYISRAKLNGIKCFVWDNCQMSGNSSFGIFKRGNLTWNEKILKGIMNGAK